jgi:photosystem II stability/assembly factor-like uncharacterized protein
MAERQLRSKKENAMTTGLYLRALAVMALASVLFLPPIPAQAQDGGLSESFADPSLPGWEVSPNARVVDGTLLIEGSGYALHGGSWQDGTTTVRFRREGPGAVALNYQASDDGSYTARFSDEGVQLLSNQGGETVEFASIPKRGLEAEWNELKVLRAGEIHTVLLNDELVLEVAAPALLPPGGIMLVVDGEASVYFDDLVVEPRTDHGQVEAPGQGQGPAEGPAAAEQPAGGFPLSGMSWVRLGGPPGGLGYDIRMRPDNPDEMYVTDARAGIFKSDNGGQIWYATNGNLVFGADAVAPIFCATIDPHDHDTVWIGTQVSGHLYRSLDGGQSWETRDDGINHDARSLRGITFDPNDPDIVYVGLEVEAGQWQREHPEATAQMVGGEVYKSTDAGQHWTRIWQGPNVARYVWVNPRNSNRVYVSTGIFDRTPANSDHSAGDPGGVGVLRSDDAGQTWTELNENHGLGGRIIPSLFMHPSDPDILLAAVFGSNINNGVYVTRDGGDTWEQSLDYALGMHNVEIATSDPDIWYAATENAAFRSDDAGQTWEQYHLATADRDAGMPIDLQVDPRDPYRIFVNNYGGSNFVSTDGAATWTDASRGYTGAQVNVFMRPDDQVVAEAQTGIFDGKDGGLTWVGLKLVDEQAPATDPSLHVLLPHGGEVLHSTDGGETWSATPVVNLRTEFEAGRIERDLVASRLAVAPSDPQMVYLAFLDGLCGTGSSGACFDPMPGFFRSSDGGYTWEEVPAGPFEDAATLGIAVHPQDSLKLFAATSSGLYFSDDGGDAWQLNRNLTDVAADVAIWDTDSPLAQSNAVIITAVVFDPHQANTLYASALQKGVFRSEDGGVTWQTAAYGMDPNEPVLVLVPDPNRPGVIYAGSAWSGAFVSTDGAQTWQQISEGLEIRSVISLALTSDGLVLYAGTFSGGTWRLGGEGELGEEPVSEEQPAAMEPEALPAPIRWGLVGGAAVLILLVGGAVGLSLRRLRKGAKSRRGRSDV